MTYLPMTVVYAVPDLPVAESSISSSMDMDMNMDMTDCHSDRVSKKCGHCSDQHNCNAAHGSCSVNFGIAAASFELTVHQAVSIWYSTVNVSAPPIYSSSLFRPPISHS